MNSKLNFSLNKNYLSHSARINNNETINSSSLNKSRKLKQNTRIRNKDSYIEYYKDRLNYNPNDINWSKFHSSVNNSQLNSDRNNFGSSSYTNLLNKKSVKFLLLNNNDDKYENHEELSNRNFSQIQRPQLNLPDKEENNNEDVDHISSQRNPPQITVSKVASQNKPILKHTHFDNFKSIEANSMFEGEHELNDLNYSKIRKNSGNEDEINVHDSNIVLTPLNKSNDNLNFDELLKANNDLDEIIQEKNLNNSQLQPSETPNNFTIKHDMVNYEKFNYEIENSNRKNEENVIQELFYNKSSKSIINKQENQSEPIDIYNNILHDNYLSNPNLEINNLKIEEISKVNTSLTKISKSKKELPEQKLMMNFETNTSNLRIKKPTINISNDEPPITNKSIENLSNRNISFSSKLKTQFDNTVFSKNQNDSMTHPNNNLHDGIDNENYLNLNEIQNSFTNKNDVISSQQNKNKVNSLTFTNKNETGFRDITNNKKIEGENHSDLTINCNKTNEVNFVQLNKNENFGMDKNKDDTIFNNSNENEINENISKKKDINKIDTYVIDTYKNESIVINTTKNETVVSETYKNNLICISNINTDKSTFIIPINTEKVTINDTHEEMIGKKDPEIIDNKNIYISENASVTNLDYKFIVNNIEAKVGKNTIEENDYQRIQTGNANKNNNSILKNLEMIETPKNAIPIEIEKIQVKNNINYCTSTQSLIDPPTNLKYNLNNIKQEEIIPSSIDESSNQMFKENENNIENYVIIDNIQNSKVITNNSISNTNMNMIDHPFIINDDNDQLSSREKKGLYILNNEDTFYSDDKTDKSKLSCNIHLNDNPMIYISPSKFEMISMKKNNYQNNSKGNIVDLHSITSDKYHENNFNLNGHKNPLESKTHDFLNIEPISIEENLNEKENLGVQNKINNNSPQNDDISKRVNLNLSDNNIDSLTKANTKSINENSNNIFEKNEQDKNVNKSFKVDDNPTHPIPLNNNENNNEKNSKNDRVGVDNINNYINNNLIDYTLENMNDDPNATPISIQENKNQINIKSNEDYLSNLDTLKVSVNAENPAEKPKRKILKYDQYAAEINEKLEKSKNERNNNNTNFLAEEKVASMTINLLNKSVNIPMNYDILKSEFSIINEKLENQLYSKMNNSVEPYILIHKISNYIYYPISIIHEKQELEKINFGLSIISHETRSHNNYKSNKNMVVINNQNLSYSNNSLHNKSPFMNLEVCNEHQIFQEYFKMINSVNQFSNKYSVEALENTRKIKNDESMNSQNFEKKSTNQLHLTHILSNEDLNLNKKENDMANTSINLSQSIQIKNQIASSNINPSTNMLSKVKQYSENLQKQLQNSKHSSKKNLFDKNTSKNYLKQEISTSHHENENKFPLSSNDKTNIAIIDNNFEPKGGFPSKINKILNSFDNDNSPDLDTQKEIPTRVKKILSINNNNPDIHSYHQENSMSPKNSDNPFTKRKLYLTNNKSLLSSPGKNSQIDATNVLTDRQFNDRVNAISKLRFAKFMGNSNKPFLSSLKQKELLNEFNDSLNPNLHLSSVANEKSSTKRIGGIVDSNISDIDLYEFKDKYFGKMHFIDKPSLILFYKRYMKDQFKRKLDDVDVDFEIKQSDKFDFQKMKERLFERKEVHENENQMKKLKQMMNNIDKSKANQKGKNSNNISLFQNIDKISSIMPSNQVSDEEF